MDVERMIRAVERSVSNGVPGVVAAITDANSTRFLHSAGVRDAASADPIEPDTVLAVHSVTKFFTATAALQCVEDGLLDLDAPAGDALPALADARVLIGFDDDGAPLTRPARSPITARHLLTHTSGFGYDLFDPDIARIARTRGECTDPLGQITFPLLHDPGERWTYGVGIDWLGLVVAETRGARLDTVLRERVFTPCAMTSTSFDVLDDMRPRLARLHRRRSDGSVQVLDGPASRHAAADLGGQGLFSTVPDLLAFLRVWLNEGSAPHGRVLESRTCALALQAAPGVVVTPLRSAITALTTDVDFFDGAPVSWALSLLRLETDLPGRRHAGSVSWAGLANVHFWIDPHSSLAGVWATQLLPWFDPLVADGVDRFERGVYAD